MGDSDGKFNCTDDKYVGLGLFATNLSRLCVPNHNIVA